jgi:DNA-binding NtrC family response regulator
LILIVDDEESILNITNSTLTKFNYKVLTATDGVEAIAVYSQNAEKIALVLTDLTMPLLDGKTLITTLKKINPQLKIVAMSGLMNAEQINELKKMQITNFLSKPFSAEILLEILAASFKP